jgi:hypothetical protein
LRGGSAHEDEPATGARRGAYRADRLISVPDKLFVARDATAAAANIRDSEWLLRLGIASELTHQAIGLFLVLAL